MGKCQPELPRIPGRCKSRCVEHAVRHAQHNDFYIVDETHESLLLPFASGYNFEIERNRGEGVQDIPGRTTLPIGSLVRGRYIIEGLLGKGGFSAVYLVRDQRTKGNLFALKEVIDPSKKERHRFTFECEVLKRLDHPVLPHVYHVFEDEGNNRAYMLMDYIKGQNLERLRQQQQERRFALPQVMTMMAPIVEAITYLHNQHPPIIHRDIKLANIIIPTIGDGPVLVDFDIAKEYDPDATTTAMRRCSPGYSAPEQYTRGTNTRTDIYALGAVFYTLLTGILPIDALRRLTQVASRGTDPLKPVSQFVPDFPTSVEDAIHRALALNSDDRFATVDEFWQAVSAHPLGVSSPAPVVAPGESSPQQPAVTPFVSLRAAMAAPKVSLYRRRRGHRTRRRYVLALSLVGLALLALFVGFAFRTSFWSTSGSFSLSTPTAAPQSVCITATTGTTVTYPSTTTTPRSVCSVTITPTTGPTVTHPSPTATPTVPPQPPPTLASSSRLTSSPSGPVPISRGHGDDHGKDKRHRCGKEHGHGKEHMKTGRRK